MRTIVSSLFILILLSVNAQDDFQLTNKANHYVGFHAGSTTGMGFSYRYTKKKFGVQATGIPVFNGSFFAASTGLSLLYTIAEHEKVEIFGYVGQHLILSKRDESVWDHDTETYYNQPVRRYFWGTGIGAGANFLLTDYLVLSTQFGYGMYSSAWETERVFFLAAEWGIYYKF